MSESNKSLLSGMGPLNKVSEAWQCELEDVVSAQSDIRDAWTALANLLDNHETARAGLALACAALNLQYRKTHWLHRVDDDGRYRTEYISDTRIHEILATSLNL